MSSERLVEPINNVHFVVAELDAKAMPFIQPLPVRVGAAAP